MLSRIANTPRYLVATACALLVASTVAYDLVEGEGLVKSAYWAVITATTVGYGDAYPTTTLGRLVAVVLVVAMVVFFIPMVTASFASRLIVDRDAFTHEEQEEIKRAVQEILRRLDETGKRSTP